MLPEDTWFPAGAEVKLAGYGDVRDRQDELVTAPALFSR